MEINFPWFLWFQLIDEIYSTGKSLGNLINLEFFIHEILIIGIGNLSLGSSSLNDRKNLPLIKFNSSAAIKL